MENYTENKFQYITASTATQVFTGRCELVALVINTAGGTIALIDGTSGTTANIGRLVAASTTGTYEYGVTLASGLRVFTESTVNITVVYRS